MVKSLFWSAVHHSLCAIGLAHSFLGVLNFLCYLEGKGYKTSIFFLKRKKNMVGGCCNDEMFMVCQGIAFSHLEPKAGY